MKMSRFGNWNFYKMCIALAAPVMLQQFLMGLVSLIDNFMVAGLGDVKMASVNVANQVNFIYMVIINTINSAGGIYLAQHNGAKNGSGMRQAFRFKLILSLLVSVIYMYLLLTIPGFFIEIMTNGNSAQADIVEYSGKYMRIIALTLIPMAFSTAIGTSYREIGKTKIPLFISVIATLINTIGNYCLIYGNFGFPRLEEQGAAIATVIARVFEMATYIIYIKLHREDFYVKTRDLFKVKIKMFISMFKKSYMLFLSEASWAFSEMFVTAIYNSKGGAETVAGMASGFTIANVFFLVFAGIHVSTSVIVGGTLGSGDLPLAKQKARWILHGAVIAGVFVALVEMTSIFIVPLVFSNLTEGAINITQGLVFVISCYMPIWAYLNAQFAIAKSGGDALFGVVVDIPVSLFLFAPLALILKKYTNISPVNMYAIAKLTDFIKLILGYFLLKKEKWVVNLTKEFKSDDDK